MGRVRCVNMTPFGQAFPHWRLHDLLSWQNDSILSHSEGSQNESFWESKISYFEIQNGVILRFKMSDFEIRKWIRKERENESKWIGFNRNESDSIGMNRNESKRIGTNRNGSERIETNQTESKRISLKRNESKRIRTNQNESKRIETNWNES